MAERILVKPLSY